MVVHRLFRDQDHPAKAEVILDPIVPDEFDRASIHGAGSPDGLQPSADCLSSRQIRSPSEFNPRSTIGGPEGRLRGSPMRWSGGLCMTTWV
jgi:hypothetical protein